MSGAVGGRDHARVVEVTVGGKEAKLRVRRCRGHRSRRNRDWMIIGRCTISTRPVILDFKMRRSDVCYAKHL